MSEIVQPLRFCDVLCISRSTCTYVYLYSYRRETARQLRMYAQLTRCFSAVAELLVNLYIVVRIVIMENGLSAAREHVLPDDFPYRLS